MKVAMLGHKRIPGREGGVEVVVEEVSTRLARRGIDVTVYNRRKKGLVLPKFYKGVRLVSVPTIEKKSTDAVVYSFIATMACVVGHYDVIHFHAIGPSFFVPIARFFGKRTVVTVHGLNYKTPKWAGMGAWFIKKGEQHVAKYADEIIVLSKAQQQYFIEKYNRDTVFIPNGTCIKEKRNADEITKKYGLKKDEYLLFLSRVVPGKGLEYLLQAYRNVNSNLKLVIAGNSPFMEEYHAKIMELVKKDDRVLMVGFVAGKILQELYSNARLFVFPSEAEGMPMCLLEAMSYDCPCLVSDIPENIEVGGQYVQRFRSCDAKKLQKQIEKAISEPRPKVHSSEYIRKNYSWENNVSRTIECYEEILRR